jgi:hypothetical protein
MRTRRKNGPWNTGFREDRETVSHKVFILIMAKILIKVLQESKDKGSHSRATLKECHAS